MRVVLGFGDVARGALVLSLAMLGCGSNKGGVDGNTAGGAGYVPSGSGGSASFRPPDGGTTGGTSATGTGSAPTPWPPSAEYTNVTDVTYGAYALGPDISSGAVPANTNTTCVGLLYGVVRDFKMGNQTGGHPDFETAPDSTNQNGVKGIVETTLGSDGKPMFANPTDPLAGITSKESFDEWYRNTPDINKAYIVALKLTTNNGISTFSASIKNGSGLQDSSFFPLDNAGFGNEEQNHNFSFTTEFHTSFTYKGKETFTFVGDDDVWVFINNKLVIDLGGRHGQLKGTVNVDDLGLIVGNTYDIAVFQAERHTVQSNFRIDTSLQFTDCGQLGPINIT